MFLRLLSLYSFFVLIIFNISSANNQFKVISWNVESGGANADTIAARMHDFDEIDIWGLCEVKDQSWVNKFEKIKQEIQENLKTNNQIHHIGSTSIPGMYAKPIIDVNIECPNYLCMFSESYRLFQIHNNNPYHKPLLSSHKHTTHRYLLLNM